MAKKNSAADVAEALSAPIGELIASIGRGVADAQAALDAKTVQSLKHMFSGDDQLLEEMRRLGYRPTWYKIPELEAEITMSLSISSESLEEGTELAGADAPVGGPGRIKLYAAPVDANYSNKYNFQATAASKLKFKVVAVPPTPEAEQMKVVPGLRNKTYQEATALLDELGIAHRLKDPQIVPAPEAKIRSFTPRVGTVLASSQSVILNV